MNYTAGFPSQPPGYAEENAPPAYIVLFISTPYSLGNDA